MPLSWALLRAAATDGRLDCAAAFHVCQSQLARPAQLAEAADALGVRVTRCQLGLFGCPKQPPEGAPSAALVQAVARWAEQGLPCAEAWRLADSLGVDRLQVGAAADAAGVKVVTCQLGCF